MKIFGTGDNHLVSGSRWEECKRIHEWIACEVRRDRPGLFVDGGDLFDKASTPEERDFAAAWIMSIADVCPFVLTTGNHDRRDDALIMSRLRAKHPIIVEQGAGVHVVAGAAVAAVAWPRRGLVAAAATAGTSSEQLDVTTREGLRSVLRGLGQQLAQHSGPRVGLGHFMADGAVSSTGQPLVGDSAAMGLDDLSLLGAPLILMSHIHLPQKFEHNGCEFVYMGSPYRRDYGEAEEKSYTVAEYDGPNLVGWHRIPIPCTPMLLLEAAWIDDNPNHAPRFDFTEPFSDLECLPEGAEIRFRYTVNVDDREAARHQAEACRQEWLRRGAVDVKLDPQTRTVSTAKAPAVAEAIGTPAKLKAMWELRCENIGGDKEARLLDGLAELEQELA